MPRSSVDRPTFLASLRQSGLLSQVQLTFVEEHLPATERPRHLARTLVELGVLTRFQAERLLAGRHAGFLLGQYRILDEIGQGGMGRVYKAEHRAMGRIVALKLLRPELVGEARGRELFLREVRAAAKLVHPNVIHAYDANEIQGRYFLVLEYVDGPDLSKLVRAKGPLEIGLACDYIRQAATGLSAAHAIGMVHRDVKPSNILVQMRGQEETGAAGLVKISDFGLARLHAVNPADLACAGTIYLKENTVMGTPDFVSPEQARNLHETDIRSDLYSLGCAFYFLLTGQVPFPGGTSLEKLIRHSTDEPAPVLHLRPDTPVTVAAIVNRLMAKEPEARFQTPAELVLALEPYAVSGPIPWGPPLPVSLPEVGDGPDDTIPVEGVNVERLTGPGDLEFDVTEGDELAGLAPTMVPDLLPTQPGSSTAEPLVRLSEHLLPSSHPFSGILPGQQSGRRALLVATSLVAAVVALFAMLHFVLGRH